ncbi:MAG: sigma-70 family RNA polymerase sigma factor [Gemmatimonadaceae bacterium]
MSSVRVIDHHDGPLTESELLAQARRGSASALGALYEAHAATLLRLGARITGSASDAEDLLHDLFVGLPELLSRYEHRSQLDAWLRAVMARMAIGRLRQGMRRERLTSSNFASARDSVSDPWDALDLDRAIAQLPETTRTVFVLRQIEGYSHSEIAALLDITSGASRVRHLRALQRLRAFLEPRS